MVDEKTFEQEMYDKIVSKLESDSDGWQSTYSYQELLKGLTEAYNLALDLAAENAQVLMSVNDNPFVSTQFSTITDSDDGSVTKKYAVYKNSILNLKINIS